MGESPGQSLTPKKVPHLPKFRQEFFTRSGLKAICTMQDLIGKYLGSMKKIIAELVPYRKIFQGPNYLKSRDIISDTLTRYHRKRNEDCFSKLAMLNELRSPAK